MTQNRTSTSAVTDGLANSPIARELRGEPSWERVLAILAAAPDDVLLDIFPCLYASSRITDVDLGSAAEAELMGRYDARQATVNATRLFDAWKAARSEGVDQHCCVTGVRVTPGGQVMTGAGYFADVDMGGMCLIRDYRAHLDEVLKSGDADFRCTPTTCICGA